MILPHNTRQDKRYTPRSEVEVTQWRTSFGLDSEIMGDEHKQWDNKEFYWKTLTDIGGTPMFSYLSNTLNANIEDMEYSRKVC